MAVDEAGGNAVAGPLDAHLDEYPRPRTLAAEGRGHLQALAKHVRATAAEEAMVAERPGIAFDAALTGSDVGHAAGRLHVAVLTVQTVAPGRAIEPFAVSAVNVDAKNDALVTGGAVAAVLVESGVGVLAAVHVVEGAEEELALAGAQQIELVAAVAQAERALPVTDDLVAVVAVDPRRRHVTDARQVRMGRVADGNRGSVARGADAGAERMFAEQAPAALRAAGGGAGVKVAEVTACGRMGMAAVLPLTVNVRVAVGAVVRLARIGGGIDPFILLVILFRQGLEIEQEGVSGERSAGDEVTLFPRRHSSRPRWAARQSKAALAVRCGRAEASLEADRRPGDRLTAVQTRPTAFVG